MTVQGIVDHIKADINALDWDTAIAGATSIIDPKPKDSAEAAPENDAVAEVYLNRGIARCFKPDKEGKHTEAVEDLSGAISRGANQAEARYYRAFAYYLDGNYERAIADCVQCKEPGINELLGKIYTAMGKYEEAVENFGAAMKLYLPGKQLPPPSLLLGYIEACKKMNNVAT